MSTQTKIWVKNKKPWRMQCKSWSKNTRIGKLIVSLYFCFVFVFFLSIVRLKFFQNFKLYKREVSYFHTSYQGHPDGFHCLFFKKIASLLNTIISKKIANHCIKIGSYRPSCSWLHNNYCLILFIRRYVRTKKRNIRFHELNLSGRSPYFDGFMSGLRKSTNTWASPVYCGTFWWRGWGRNARPRDWVSTAPKRYSV